FTSISDAAGLAKIADTLSEHRAIGRLSQVCERWIYSGVCFALDYDEQKRSGFRYQYSNYQIEYSRNLVFRVGAHMDQVFQALIDRSRAPLDLKTIKTILGYKHRPKNRRRPAHWEVAVEKPVYDLTIFKLHCGKLTLKIYTKGERVLRIEAVAHNIQELNCGRSLEYFPELVCRLKAMLERFADALSCIDQCFIADDMLERLPLASRVGKTLVGGIDLNKARMRHVVEALIALSPSANGFTASDLAPPPPRRRCPLFTQNTPSPARPPPRCLRSQKTPRQTDRSADRPHSPVPHTPGRPSRNRRPPSASQQSHQTPARCRSTSPPNWRRAQPETHRHPLPCHTGCHARRLSRARPCRLNIDNFFAGLRP